LTEAHLEDVEVLLIRALAACCGLPPLLQLSLLAVVAAAGCCCWLLLLLAAAVAADCRQYWHNLLARERITTC
jgi:hypothetical protein